MTVPELMDNDMTREIIAASCDRDNFGNLSFLLPIYRIWSMIFS